MYLSQEHFLKNTLPSWENKIIYLPGSLWEISGSGLGGRSTSLGTERKKIIKHCTLNATFGVKPNPQIKYPEKHE